MSRIRGLELLFNIEKKNFKSPADCVVAVFHCLLINEGLECAGIDDAWPETAEPTTEMLPRDWNKSQDVYSLRYVNKDRSNRVLLKIVKADPILMVNAVMNEDIVAAITVPISNHVSDNYEDYASAYKDLESLVESFRKDVMDTLMGKSKKSTEERKKQDPSPSSSPLFIPGPPSSGAGMGTGRERIPQVPHFPRVGGSDLDPFGGMGGGGMFMDPSGFGVPPGPTLPQFGVGGPGGLPRGAVPPGARFDPFMPPIHPGGFRPDPDHFRRPDGNDFI